MLARWRAGDTSVAKEQEVRGRVLACGDINELQLQSIRNLYGLPAPE